MIDRDSIARWPQPEFTCKQASSYDRAKIAPDKPGWFGNNDRNQYIRVEKNGERTEHVMLDADGPGAIVRFWIVPNNAKRGKVRLYLDDARDPVIATQENGMLLNDAMDINAPWLLNHPGSKFPGQGGNTLYLPIPYHKHCKVTWEDADPNQGGDLCYQINYRTYAAGTTVKTFSLGQLEASRALLDHVGHILEISLPPPESKVSSIQEALAPGARASLDLPVGPAAVRAMELRLATEDRTQAQRDLRGIAIQCTFDDEVTVWCPATDFFGSGVGFNNLESWYRTVSTSGVMRCFWAMPYAKNARITLINTGARPVKAALHATTSPWIWDDRSMHFHAAWHFESELKTPPARDWNYVRITGRGVYAGDSLALFNPVPTWYGEGDEKIWIDDETFPSHLGTGTEDYYNYSYAPKGIMQTPFANQVRIDEPRTQGHNVLSRTRNLDGIPFRKSLQFDIELISWQPTTLTYAATTYWYALPGATSNVPPNPKGAAGPIPSIHP